MIRKWNVFVVLLLLLAVLTSCGEKITDGNTIAVSNHQNGLVLPLDDKGTEISILCESNNTNLQDSLIVKELSKRTGLYVKIVAVPRSIYNEKARVLLASKSEMPDIFRGGFDIGGLNLYEINDFAMQGAFEPINPHIGQLPNFKEIFVDKAEEYGTQRMFSDYSAPDGMLYVFPRYHTDRQVNHGILYRKDIFDGLGIPMWNNKEEFYQALKTVKAAYPESQPFTTKWGITFFQQIGQSWGIDFPDVYFEEETGRWKHSATDEKLKEMLDYLRRLYDEKLLDKEFLTNTESQWTSKMTARNSSFVTFDWIGRLDAFYDSVKDTNPSYDLRYGNPIGPTGKVITLPAVNEGPAIKKSEKSLLAMQLCDYLLSPEGAELITLGIPGETYEIGEDGFADYYGFEEGKAISIQNLEEKYGLFIPGMYRRFDERSIYFNFTEKEQEAQDLMTNKPGGGFLPEDPMVSLTNEEREIVNDKNNRIMKEAEEFVSKYILTEHTGDEAWNAWIARAHQLGVDEVVQCYQAAQKRYEQN